jgi:hypothetical protein
MAKARRRTRRPPNPRREFSSFSRRIRAFENTAKAAARRHQSQRTAYVRLVRSLAREARRRGWHVSLGTSRRYR